jgi:hypothetical protein
MCQARMPLQQHSCMTDGCGGRYQGAAARLLPDMRDMLGAVGALIVALSAIYYALDVVRGETRPQRTSWGVWALVGLLGFGTAHDGGAGPGAWAAGVDALACIVTFLLSLHPRLGKAGGNRHDLVMGAVAVAGVLLWRWGPLSDGGAALLAVSCESVALWPTLREAWRQPQTESFASWTVDVLGNGLCVSAVATVSLASLAYPLFVLAAAVAMSTVLTARRLHPQLTGRQAPTPVRVPAVPSPQAG